MLQWSVILVLKKKKKQSAWNKRYIYECTQKARNSKKKKKCKKYPKAWNMLPYSYSGEGDLSFRYYFSFQLQLNTENTEFVKI